ncbi:MAG: hypothetical protein AB8B50_12010 [Pirellulaceae bacterium]
MLEVKGDHSLRECDHLTQASEPRLLEENELAVREYGELGWHFRQQPGIRLRTIAKKESRVESGTYNSEATLAETDFGWMYA